MPSAFAAVIILIIGFILSGLLRKGAAFLFSKLKIDECINRDRENKLTIESSAATFVYYLALL